MKKVAFMFVAVAAMSFASCGNKTATAEAVDTLAAEADTLVEEVVDTLAEAADTAAAEVVEEAAEVVAEPAAE